MRFNRPALCNLLATLLLAGLAQACSFNPPDCHSQQVFCVGYVSDVAGLEDAGLNQAAWAAIETLAQVHGFQAQAIESADSREYGKNMDFFLAAGVDVLVTGGFGPGDATRERAQAHPEVLFIGLGQSHTDEDSPLPRNLAWLTFPEDQAGFLAGALAASFTETGLVGAVLPHEAIPGMSWYGQGFCNGAQHLLEDVNCQLRYNSESSFEGSFSDPFWGEQAAQTLVADGVDVILAYGGSTGNSALRAAAAENAFLVGVEQDLAVSMPDVRHRLLASIVPHPAPALEEILLQALAGEFQPGERAGGFMLAPGRGVEISAYLQEQLEVLRLQLENGILSTGVQKEEPAPPEVDTF